MSKPWSRVSRAKAVRLQHRQCCGAQRILWQTGAKAVRVHCGEPLPLHKGVWALAQRFGFREKPPVLMATSGRGQPQLLDLHNWEFKSGRTLAERALAALENKKRKK